jgi:TolB protein
LAALLPEHIPSLQEENRRYQVNHTKIILASTLLVVAILLGGATAFASGTGPDDARAPVADWLPLAPGETVWYAFQYAGDGSQIRVQLEVEPAGGAAFLVWTPEQIRRWGLGEEVHPIGRGSADPSAGGGLLWTGSFNDAGTYYVVVEPSGSLGGTSYYLLDVSGDGVSLSAPAPAPAVTAKPARPKAATPSEPTGKLAFQTSMGGDIYTINVDGSDLKRITDGMDPVWSPSGAQIAFARWREPRGVWVVSADGAGERRVFDWSETRYPSWSPSGEIVFTRHTGGRPAREFCFRGQCFPIPATSFWKLGIVDAASGAFVEPSATSDVSHTPDWSPDGTSIVYDGDRGLRVQSVDGKTFYDLTDDVKDTNPVWSPGGEHVAYTHRQHDHWEIYVVDADGSDRTRLTSTPSKPDGEVGNSVSPAWSPDNQYIAFLTDRTGAWEIWVMRADGSGQKPMFGSELDGITLDYASLGERVISWTQ